MVEPKGLTGVIGSGKKFMQTVMNVMTVLNLKKLNSIYDCKNNVL